MKRSTINQAFLQASQCFSQRGWALPPQPKWDITDFGLGAFASQGLTLINLADEKEYCEKLMYARRDQRTPCHAHAKKKEDIICRYGALRFWLWPHRPDPAQDKSSQEFAVRIDGAMTAVRGGVPLELAAGSRLTLEPWIWHAFAPASDESIIGEVSTANDDANDNFFLDPNVGRYPDIEEDEPALIRLVGE